MFHLSSPLCLVSSFSDQPTVTGLSLSGLFLIFSTLCGGWQSHTKAPKLLETALSHTMNGFFCHGREERGKMGCTRASFHRGFSLIAKLFPNTPSPSPCPAQRPHMQHPHEAIEKIYAMLQGPGRVTAGNVHCSVLSHPQLGGKKGRAIAG